MTGMEERQHICSNRLIVDKLAQDRVVETICQKITKGKDSDTLNDLCQDIYCQLLESDKTVGLYERNEIKYWIAKVLMNNICSSSSPYYRKYIYPISKSNDIAIGEDWYNPTGNKEDR